jgi:hypothetical protein
MAQLRELRQWRRLRTHARAALAVDNSGRAATYLAQVTKMMSADEQSAVVEMLAQNPDLGEVLEGTGGVRKVRIPLEGRDKSGGARVIYSFEIARCPSSC